MKILYEITIPSEEKSSDHIFKIKKFESYLAWACKKMFGSFERVYFTTKSYQYDWKKLSKVTMKHKIIFEIEMHLTDNDSENTYLLKVLENKLRLSTNECKAQLLRYEVKECQATNPTERE